MASALSVYLHDHMAGSNFAVDLLKSLQDQFSEQSLGAFASDLLVLVEHDRKILQAVIDRVGESSTGLKDAVAWAAERLSRMKLARASGDLGAFEALEMLEVGIFGKLSLWRVLAKIVVLDVRLQGFDYSGLALSAETQIDRVEAVRLEVALQVFET